MKSFCLAAALMSGLACGGGANASLGPDGGDGGPAGGGGQTGSGNSSAKTTLARDPVDYAGDGIGSVGANATAAGFTVAINEGAASCATGQQLLLGKHSFWFTIARMGDHPAQLTTATYASTDLAVANSLHLEAYLSNVVANSNGTCSANQYAGNGGDQPYSLTISEFDAIHIAGTYNITISYGHEAGVPVTGSFNTPLCGAPHVLDSCH